MDDAITLEELQLAARNHGLPLESLREAITPVGLHYLLIHFDIPAVDAHAWRLQVDGLVERPLELTLDELRARPARTVPVTLECAGNGRDQAVDALAQSDRVGALRVVAALIDALEPAGEVERAPGHALADPFGHQRLHARTRPCSAPVTHTQPPSLMPRSAASSGLIVDEHVLLQLGEPLVGARLFAAAFVFDEAARGQDQRELLGDTLSTAAFCTSKPTLGTRN